MIILTTNHGIEELLKEINNIYQARQQERIVYQRREIQIRREIENISHDLRTPLTSIIGYVELMQDAQTNETGRAEYLQVIRKRAKVLQGFIQDFFELSRIEGENYPLLELGLIFDRFYTGDLSRNNQSAGLGLTISKKLVDKMKGNIEARLDDNLFVIELRFKVQPKRSD